MPASLDDILPLLNANCGDAIKSAVLKVLFSLDTAHLGDPITAATKPIKAAASASIGAPQPVAEGADTPPSRLPPIKDDVDEEIRRRIGRPWDGTGVEMDTTSSETKEPNLSNEGEVEVDGEVYVTAERAAELRGTSVKAIGVAACQKKWRRTRHDGLKRVVYLREDVIAGRRKDLKAA